MEKKLTKEEILMQSRRGGTNYLRRRISFLLAVLFQDLKGKNKDGIDPNVCGAIQGTLAKLAASDAAEGPYSSAHWNPPVQAIRETYYAWNDAPKSDVTKRESNLRRLKARRIRFFGQFGLWKQAGLVEEFDRAFFNGILDGFEVLGESHAAVFPELRRHVRRERGKIGRSAQRQ